MFSSALLGLALAASVEADTSQPSTAPSSVVEARLTRVEDIAGQPGAPCICDENDNLMLDGSWRLYFAPLRTLYGPAVRARLYFDQASARPITGRKYLLVVSHEDSGSVVVWTGSVAGGLCLEANEITAYGIEAASRKRPCRN